MISPCTRCEFYRNLLSQIPFYLVDVSKIRSAFVQYTPI